MAGKIYHLQNIIPWDFYFWSLSVALWVFLSRVYHRPQASAVKKLTNIYHWYLSCANFSPCQMTSYSLIWPYCMFRNSPPWSEWGSSVTRYICLPHTTSAKFFRGLPRLPFLGTSVADNGFSSWTSSFTVSCVPSVEESLALVSSVPVLGSLMVRALEK